MKKKKNDVAELKSLTVEEMKKINGGGYWAIYTTPDGITMKVWVKS